jgi:hypothetical protein
VVRPCRIDRGGQGRGRAADPPPGAAPPARDDAERLPRPDRRDRSRRRARHGRRRAEGRRRRPDGGAGSRATRRP